MSACFKHGLENRMHSQLTHRSTGPAQKTEQPGEFRCKPFNQRRREAMRNSAVRIPFFWVAAFLFLTGCSTIAPFSQTAYEKATSLKVEALATMDKASEPYADQKQSIDNLKINLEKAYEYAKGRPQNEETTKQWEIIKDPSRNSLGGFLKLWQDKSILDKNFIQEAKSVVSDGFDTVIELESGKRKSTEGQK